MGIFQKINNRKILLLSCLHFLISLVLSADFFHPIRENAGGENVAYKFLQTGLVLPEDSLSRLLCRVYAYALAFLLIYVFWTWLFHLLDIWKKKIIKRSWLVAFTALTVTGIMIIAVVYPSTIVNATDTTWNYVYAKEWLPIYWHGFFTNVVHCACMIVFPHPIAMSLIPFLFGISEVCYFTYIAFVKFSSRNETVKVILWGGVLILMPETLRILSYAGRNYMFALLSAGYIGSFMADYISEGDLSVSKFIRLSCMAALLGTWRSEGIFYLLFFPILLYFTYFFHKKKIAKAALIKAAVFVAVCYFVLWLPGKYGSEKYQGYDYVIVNTPEPLSVVFADENADLSYSGAEDDLKCIYSVIPREYFEKYGELSQFFYNFDSLRTPRQSGIGEKGKEYVSAAYRILLHNWKTYLKKQFNNYNESIGLDCFFNLPEQAKEDWTANASEEAYGYFKWIWAYFDKGKEDISLNYDIVIVNEKIDTILNSAVTELLAHIYKSGWKISGFMKTAVLILMMISVVIALCKREWVFFFIGVLILGILLAVILTAPTMRENYYYSSYFNSYWYLLFGLSYMMNHNNSGRKRLENFK